MQQANIIGPGSPSVNNYIPYQTYTEQNYQSNPNVFSGFSPTMQPYNIGNKVGTNGNFGNIINKRENKNINEGRNFKDWKKFWITLYYFNKLIILLKYFNRIYCKFIIYYKM